MSMFCFQCEQTMKGTGCTIQGVCGKDVPTALEQDNLTAEMINLAAAVTISSKHSKKAVELIIDGLFTCVTNVDFDHAKVAEVKEKVIKEREKIQKENNITSVLYKPQDLWQGDTDDRSLRSTLLFGLRGMSAYAHHAKVLGVEDEEVNNWFIKGLNSFTQNLTIEERLSLIMEFGKVNLRCMEILDQANTAAYGTPEPAKVTTNIEKALLL